MKLLILLMVLDMHQSVFRFLLNDKVWIDLVLGSMRYNPFQEH